MDPLGQETGAIDPFLINPNSNYGDIHGDTPMFVDGGDPFHLSDGCGDIDGMPASCEEIADRIVDGSVKAEVNGGGGRKGGMVALPDLGLGYIPTGVWVTTENTSTANTPVAPSANQKLVGSYWAPFGGSFGFTQGKPATPQQPPKPPKVDKTISDAVALTRTILSGTNPCATWFGNNALQALNDLEKKLTRGIVDGPGNTQTGIRMSGGTSFVGNPVQYRVFQNAVINNNGPFISIISKTRIGGYDPGRHQSQVLQILHELAHMIYQNGNTLIPGDVDLSNPSIDKSDDNTKEVLNHCKVEVDAVKN